MGGLGCEGMINISLWQEMYGLEPATMRGSSTNLFAGAHTSVDLVDQPAANHLEKNDASTGVKYLLVCRAVGLVLHIRV